MLIYTLAASTNTWGDGNTCMLLTITDAATGETRTCEDFTYFDEEPTQYLLEELFATMEGKLCLRN